jgi:hypothetical protein
MTAAALKDLPDHKAAWLLPVRLRRAQLQKVARYRRDDSALQWANWSELVVNESLFLQAGAYRVDGERQTWAAASAETALCYGKNAPFETVAEVPPWILTQCQAGAARAIARANGRRIRLSGADLGNRLGMTWDMREELKAWLIWPAGATENDLAERRKQRASDRRAYLREAKMKERRARGAVSRADYLDEAALRREACALAEISDRTFKRRSPEDKERLLEAARAARRASGPCQSTRQYRHCTVDGVGTRAADNRPVAKIFVFPDRPRISPNDPAFHDKIAAFLATKAEGGASSAPPIPADDQPPPSEEIARLDWWKQPVAGWREGRLEIRSILTGEATVIRLSDGAILSHENEESCHDQ